MPIAFSRSRSADMQNRIAREAMEIASEATGVALFDIMAKGRLKSRVAFARQIAMYLAHVVGQMTLTEISAAFERDRSTAGHACHAIEDRREGALFDREIEALESALRARLNAIYARQSLKVTTSNWDTVVARRKLAKKFVS